MNRLLSLFWSWGEDIRVRIGALLRSLGKHCRSVVSFFLQAVPTHADALVNMLCQIRTEIVFVSELLGQAVVIIIQMQENPVYLVYIDLDFYHRCVK